jgi:hypothetical protein
MCLQQPLESTATTSSSPHRAPGKNREARFFIGHFHIARLYSQDSANSTAPPLLETLSLRLSQLVGHWHGVPYFSTLGGFIILA